MASWAPRTLTPMVGLRGEHSPKLQTAGGSMKTFRALIQDVVKPGLCYRCGGCVTFCKAINYGALEMGPDGLPRYKDPEKCVECGFCHMFCPAVGQLEDEVRRQTAWREPMGNVVEVAVARAKDATVRERGTDGGVVTAILLRLFDEGRIDGAVVARTTGLFRREPLLATTRQEILDAAGCAFDPGRGMSVFSPRYSTYAPSIQALGSLVRKGLRRVAVVGVPEQIKVIRKMQSLGVVPTDSIYCLFGLFCSGSYEFGESQRGALEALGGFAWQDVTRVNVREVLRLRLRDGRVADIPLDKLIFIRRPACAFCEDYAAEFADISFGGLGAEPGWTTVITRTPLGRAIFADVRGAVLDQSRAEEDQPRAAEAQRTVLEHSRRKKDAAAVNLRRLAEQASVAVED